MSATFNSVDGVIEKTLNSMEESKYQIFEIAEQAREEIEHLQQEIEKIKREVGEVIDKHDKVEKAFKKARLRLSEVSKNFRINTEDEIRKAYEEASAIQLEKSLLEEKEAQLRMRRDDLQLRLRRVEHTVERAEGVLTQISLVMEYLAGDIREMAQQLKDVHQQQLLGFKVIQAQEDERKRLAREIHDGPAQSMAHLLLKMDLVEKVSFREGIEQAKEELRKLKESARASLADVRRIIFDLRPMALDDLGLVPTLKKYLEKLEQDMGLKIKFKTPRKEERPPSAMEVAIFRLIQESLNNVVKHSKATKVHVKLDFSNEQVKVIIEDNGIGFDPQKQSEKGFGLLGMQERVRLINGQLSVESAPGKGTEVAFTIPFHKEQNEEGKYDDEQNKAGKHTAHR